MTDDKVFMVEDESIPPQRIILNPEEVFGMEEVSELVNDARIYLWNVAVRRKENNEELLYRFVYRTASNRDVYSKGIRGYYKILTLPGNWSFGHPEGMLPE